MMAFQIDVEPHLMVTAPVCTVSLSRVAERCTDSDVTSTNTPTAPSVAVLDWS